MKKILITLTLGFTALTGFSQSTDNAYGPVKTKEIKETVGQTYVVIALDKQDAKRGYTTIKNIKQNQPLPPTEKGKHLILKNIDNEHHALFEDSLGNEYRVHVYEDNGNQMLDLMLLSDFLEAKKLFLIKTLWLNDNEIWGSDRLDESIVDNEVKNIRFEPVIVQDIYFNSIVDEPLIFKVRTLKGQIGYVATSVSGTNTTKLPEDLFYTHFFDKDPKTLYHFTPAMWQIIKGGGLPVKGMPLDAAILMMGRPTKINTSTLGSKVRTQLVYGDTEPSYYYFEGNKYVGRN